MSHPSHQQNETSNWRSQRDAYRDRSRRQRQQAYANRNENRLNRRHQYEKSYTQRKNNRRYRVKRLDDERRQRAPDPGIHRRGAHLPQTQPRSRKDKDSLPLQRRLHIHQLSNGITLYERELQFSRIFWETLQSLATQKQVLLFGLNTSVITHPGVWYGVWDQFSCDVPRQIVIFQGELHRDPYRLFHALNERMGPLSSRWLVAFLNQAPLADMFRQVFEHAQILFPDAHMAEEKQDRACPPVIGVTCAENTLCLTYRKTFRVFRIADDGKETVTIRRAHVIYRLHFRPRGKAVVKWWYVDPTLKN